MYAYVYYGLCHWWREFIDAFKRYFRKIGSRIRIECQISYLREILCDVLLCNSSIIENYQNQRHLATLNQEQAFHFCF